MFFLKYFDHKKSWSPFGVQNDHKNRRKKISIAKILITEILITKTAKKHFRSPKFSCSPNRVKKLFYLPKCDQALLSQIRDQLITKATRTLDSNKK